MDFIIVLINCLTIAFAAGYFRSAYMDYHNYVKPYETASRPPWPMYVMIVTIIAAVTNLISLLAVLEVI